MGLMAVRAVLALGVAGLAQAGAQRVGRVAGRRRALWAVAGLAVAFGSGLLQLGSHWGDWGGEWLTSLTGWAGGGLISACIGAMVLVGLVRFAPERTLRPFYLGLANTLAWLLLVVSLGGFVWWPMATGARTNWPDGDGLLRQSTGTTCAAASGAMLLARYGWRVSEGEVAAQADTSPLTGTNMYSLAWGLNRLVAARGASAHAGSLAECRRSAPDRPFVGSVWLPGLGWHAVLVVPQSERLRVADPLVPQWTMETDQSLGLNPRSIVVWLERRSA